MTRVILDPMCIKGTIALAIDNRGTLLPCCQCDNPLTINHPLMKPLIAVSNINDHDTIHEILLQDEWKVFEENLKKNIGPPACIKACSVRSSDYKLTEILVDPDTGTQSIFTEY